MKHTEGNKLIADFMGMIGINEHLYRKHNAPWIQTGAENLEYHTSWDWLMPVVEKINKTDIPNNDFPASVIIFKTTVHINDDEQILIETTATKEGGLIGAIWQAVVEFIKWYNTNPQTPQ